MTDPPAPKLEEHQIRVLVCDDHELVREALRAIISREPDMEVVGEACDGVQAVDLAAELRPDAIIMDIQMPRVSGVVAAQRISGLLPEATILVLTVHDDIEYILRMLQVGVTSYLTKEVLSRHIPVAIRAARHGESLISEDMLKKLLVRALRPGSEDEGSAIRDRLTERETAVLELAAKGYSNKSIAGQLGITENTVKKYMKEVFDKLNVYSRTAAVITAQQKGVIPREI